MILILKVVVHFNNDNSNVNVKVIMKLTYKIIS